MCYRSKIEILSREIAAEYFAGIKRHYNRSEPLKSTEEYVDEHWPRWAKTSANLIVLLEDHT